MTEQQRTRWNVLALNSLFGYQFENGTQKDHFAIAYCHEDLDEEVLRLVKEESGAESLVHSDFIGHGFLKIHMRDLERVPAIFTSMLSHNQWFRTNNKAQVGFNAERDNDREFTDVIMELKFVEQIRRNILNIPYMRKLTLNSSNSLIPWPAYKIWNYKTDVGRHLCLELRELARKGPPNLDSKTNYLKWAVFIDEPEEEEEEVEQKAKRPHVETEPVVEEEEEECMVCLDRVPNTRVEPCGCVVVCSECSEGLKDTADVLTCVHCRRPITGVFPVE